MKRFVLLLCVFLAVSAVVFGQAQSPAQSIETVAIVRLNKNENITVGQYKAFVNLSTLAKMISSRNLSAQLTPAEKREALDALGEQMLIYQAAERENLLVEDRIIEQYVEQEMAGISNLIAQQNGGKVPTPAELDAVLQERYGMNRADYKKFTAYRLNTRNYIEKKKQSLLESITLPTEAELLVPYNERKGRSMLQQGFFVPESIVVHMIVVPFRDESQKAKARTTANTVAQRIGSDVKKFDQEFESMPRNLASVSGAEVVASPYELYNDPLIRNSWGEAFVNAAFGLQQGSISRVLEASDGFYLLKVTQNKPAKTLAMTDVVGQARDPRNPNRVMNITVRDFLGEEEMRRRYDTTYLRAYEEVVADLKKRGSVQIITGTYDRIVW